MQVKKTKNPAGDNVNNDLQELLDLLEAKETQLKYNKRSAIFPDAGPYSRAKYPKHTIFMDAGREFSERAFVAANRTGKTLTGAFEMSYHLTGRYPEWWTGKRFLNAVDAWAAGISNQSTKEILQFELLGDIDNMGSGMIPLEYIVKKPTGELRVTKKPGVADAVETVYVHHVSGGVSRCTFKSYEQGRASFQGTKKQVIWLDEEPTDPGIYSECLTRLMDKFNPGIIYCTFTPLFGLSEVVLSFLPDGNFPLGGRNPKNTQKFVVNVDWSEVPHLDEKQKANILESYSRHERDARSKGIPSLGAGAIYPYTEDMVVVDPFPIPAWWVKGYGMDTGWSRTAVIWGAMDPESKIMYLYSEHYQSEAHPAIHAAAIKARGNWMVGAADPAGANLSDGKKIFDMYIEEGLNIIKADKRDREGGILKLGQMFESGQLKIFSTLKNTLSEIRTYRRDEKGEIVKKNDHAMDAMRYLCTTGIDYLTSPMDDDESDISDSSGGRDEYTGY